MSKSSVDILELNIPNVNFSLKVEDKRRKELYKKQRTERGFDDSETYDLFVTIAKFILPRLQRFKELHNENVEVEESFEKFLEDFEDSLKIVVRDDMNSEDHLKVAETLKELSKYYLYERENPFPLGEGMIAISLGFQYIA